MNLRAHTFVSRALLCACLLGALSTTSCSGSFDAPLDLAPGDPDRPGATTPFATQDTEPEEPDPEPALEVVDSVDFSRALTGDEEIREITVRNVGDAPLELQDVFVEDPDGAFSLVTDDLPAALEPRTSVAVDVRFAPATSLVHSGALVLATNDPTTPRRAVSLVGNQAPCVTVRGAAPVEGTSTFYELSFGDASPGEARTQTLRLSNCARARDLNIERIELVGPGFELVGDASPVLLSPREDLDVEVRFTASELGENEARLVVGTDDPARPRVVANLSAVVSPNECPTSVALARIKGSPERTAQRLEVPALSTVEFDASSSYDPDGSIQRYEWSITRKPLGSNARLGPSSAVASPDLFLDMVGEYVIELTVADNLLARSCASSSVFITAVDDADIHVQLTWETPGDPDPSDVTVADVDLHYLHPLGRWNEAPWDIFWRNPAADWGIPGDAADDPQLRVLGPRQESIMHDLPSPNDTYTIGVHYTEDRGFGATHARIRIYSQGILLVETSSRVLETRGSFWEVGTIDGLRRTVVLTDVVHQGFPSR